jgi:ubiquinone/menaquinone biosynthesis C-methylase UbiE
VSGRQQRAVLPVILRLHARGGVVGDEQRRVGNRVMASLRAARREWLVSSTATGGAVAPERDAAYIVHVDRLMALHDADTAARLAVGGNWDAIGRLERDLLVYAGLKPSHVVLDVGCGSGRLAFALRDYLTDGSYIGTDVVPRLLAYASSRLPEPMWRFVPASGYTLPVDPGTVDAVTFFSVFTHLLHEETYRYLEAAAAALRPGGMIVFSFLEFAVPAHWAVFESMLAAMGTAGHHNQFMSRDAIEVFADRLSLTVEEVHNGSESFIPLSSPVTFDDGRTFEGHGPLGQSVCILRAEA